MLHADFASLLPSVKREMIERALADEIAFAARLVTFTSGVGRTHTYATVHLPTHRGGAGEFVTWLVCPQNVGPRMARSGKYSGSLYFDSGHYGFDSEQAAASDMYARANR
jgi:hypothetical protein